MDEELLPIIVESAIPDINDYRKWLVASAMPHSHEPVLARLAIFNY